MAAVSTETPSQASITQPPTSWLEPADDILYEIVDQQIRELPRMGAREVHLASTLSRILSGFAWNNKLGHVESEMLFLLDRAKNLQRRPDLAFVSYERWAHDRAIPAEPAWEVVPNLAIEVISPKSFANDVVQKIEDYFVSGVERVWVIYPLVAKVYDYESPSSVRILASRDPMQAEAVLPGLEIPLTDLFDTGTKPK